MLNDGAVRLPPQYERILAQSQAAAFTMNSDVLTGEVLRALARSKPGGIFLELGTGCGLGTCWLLDGMSEGSRLISVDSDARVQAIARAELGADERLTLALGDGGEFLQTCDRRFELIIDASSTRIRARRSSTRLRRWTRSLRCTRSWPHHPCCRAPCTSRRADTRTRGATE